VAPGDTLPPQRTISSGFYTNVLPLEFLKVENYVFEPTQTDPADFYVENFEDPDAAGLRLRWPSSDSLNTTVGQDPAGSKGRAMRVTTQGGGASAGDRVERIFPTPRDWLGLTAFTFAIKPDQPTAAVQWRVRIVDKDGASRSALVPASELNRWTTVSIPLRLFADDSPMVSNLLNVQRIQFECATGTAPGTTGFDEIAIASTLDVPVLDTLYYAQAGASRSENVVMTYYHGHDSKPFIFSGFDLWGYKKAQLQRLVDFVLQRLWGLSNSSGVGLRSRPVGVVRMRPMASAAMPAAPSVRPAAGDPRRPSTGAAAGRPGGTLAPPAQPAGRER
jgi:hypothetical protein